jgi:predicted nucleic acid-binding protein
MTTSVDTNVLIAVTTPGHKFQSWCSSTMHSRKLEGPIIVSDIVYCEFTMGFDSVNDVNAVMAELELERQRLSDSALFLAGRAFLRYKREHDGPKLNVLPDFFVGAMAEIAAQPLMTCNAGDFLTYFERLELILP